jgi:DNA repair protein RadC
MKIMEKKFSLEQLNNVSEIDIAYKRKATCKVSERPAVSSSADAYELLAHYWNPDKIELLEEFKVLFLNRSNKVLYILSLSQGGITGTVADPRLILGVAVKIAACNLILAHNHPSGSLQPSRADEELTYKIREAAKYFDIKVLDHVIITADGYLSFADEGLLL